MTGKLVQLHQEIIYQLKITLKYSEPPIWRRVEVPSGFSLYQLHWIIQAVMEWENCHLWQFSKGKINYGDQDFNEFMPELEPPEDVREILLSDVLPRVKSKMLYEYDFGDCWVHEIVLEKKLPLDPGTFYPRCAKGELAAPPEDCGGIGGFYDMMECLADPDDEEYESIKEWLGDEYNPDVFDIERVNKNLLQVSQNSQSTMERQSNLEEKPLPETKKEWLADIAEAYKEAVDAKSIAESMQGASLTDEDLFHLTPYICIDFRGIEVTEKEMAEIDESVMSGYILIMDGEKTGKILEKSPILAFCFCYLAAHYVVGLIDEKQVDDIMDHCVKQLDRLEKLIGPT